MVSADELDVDSLELTAIEPPVQTPPVQAPDTSKTAPVDEAQGRRGKGKPSSRPPSVVEEELGLVTPPSAGPPLWRVTESIEDFYGNENTDAASTSNASAEPVNMTASATAAATPTADTRRASQSAAPSAPRPRRTPPQPDDWAYFESVTERNQGSHPAVG